MPPATTPATPPVARTVRSRSRANSFAPYKPRSLATKPSATQAQAPAVRTDYWHTGLSMEIIKSRSMPGPMEQDDKGRINVIPIVGSYDPTTPGVALSEAFLERGAANGDEFVFTMLVAGRAGGLYEFCTEMEYEVMKVRIIWPGLEHLGWMTDMCLFYVSDGTRTTLQQLLYHIAVQYNQLYQRMEDLGGSRNVIRTEGVPIGYGKDEVRFEQLRILRLYSNDKGKSWIAEMGVVRRN